MRKIKIAILLTLILNVGCSDSNSEFDKTLTNFSDVLAEINSAELEKITTKKGFNSIMDWSDSLRNTKFLHDLSDDLKNGGDGIFHTNDLDSIIILSLGESDEIVGATGGALFLRKIDTVYKIDEFRGGK
ncbi:hypothetical protein [Aureivirga sp. CE67]|uniref:hypothetical protein n=1 Tax=Aureivirga sp. CE67 TaxID=1788983 RepID=UPI0018C98563|nr:hypothetical protein [Aureivirga sp. CE67]